MTYSSDLTDAEWEIFGVAESVYDGLRNGHLSELEVVK